MIRMIVIIGMIATMMLLCTGCGTTTITERTVIRERIDTLTVAGDTVYVEATGELTYYDTVHVTGLESFDFAQDKHGAVGSEQWAMGGVKAFIASIDTTVERIRLQAKYRYPANQWNVKIVQRDTVVLYVVRDSLITNTSVEKVSVTPWWNWVVFTLIGVVVVGLFLKKLAPKISIGN